MATIAFVVTPLTGAFNATLKLARDLENCGHRIYYLGLPDSEGVARSNGFDFVPIFERWFDKGFFEMYDRTDPLDSRDAMWVAKSIASGFVEFITALIDGKDRSFYLKLEELRPDLLILEHSNQSVSIPGLLAYPLGIKCVYLLSMIARSQDPYIPPVTSGLIPEDSLRYRLLNFIAWKKIFLKNRIGGKVFSAMGLDVDWHLLMTRLARSCGYPLSLLEKTTDSVAIKMQLPEIVLWPREFDFPGADRPGRYYVEASIDIDRRQTGVSTLELDPNKPLGYCAMGTLGWLSRSETFRFFQTVLSAAGTLPSWQWVVAVGNTFNAEDFASIPDNVKILQYAPQLEILKQAALMISHGGANTVKECIYFGVPMILFPEIYDHPGTAARVSHHGLGVTGDARSLTTESLLDLIARVDNSVLIKVQMRLMQSKFKEREESKAALRIVESILALPGASLLASADSMGFDIKRK